MRLSGGVGKISQDGLKNHLREWGRDTGLGFLLWVEVSLCEDSYSCTGA